MASVKVVDSIMGSGKTSWALQHINEAPANKRFIYITPYLDEVQRVIKGATDRKFLEPNNANNEGRKLRSLKELIISGNDICATHSLFQMADDELIELLTDSGYELILDEVMNVIEKANIGRHDIKALVETGYIEIRDNRVYWIYEDYVDGRFDDIKLLAKAGNLFLHRNSFLLWAFPPRVFQAFDNVTILTYLFDAQIQRYYYDLHGINYEYQAVSKVGDRYDLVEYDRMKEGREEVMTLINLYDGHLNDIGEPRNAFGARWLRGASGDVLDRIRKNIYDFFRNICKAKSNEILWTTLKERRKKLQGSGYTKSFIACNVRATNKYGDRRALAYVFNRYLSPIEKTFFEDNGVSVNQDLLAVSDLLQWTWRSRIRNGEPIDLYLPSSRMRSLLKKWSEYEI